MNQKQDTMHQQHVNELTENASWLADISHWRREQRVALALLARAEAIIRERELQIERHADAVMAEESHVSAHEQSMALHQQARSGGGLDVLDVEHARMEATRGKTREAHDRFSVTQRCIVSALQQLVDTLKDTA